MRQLVARVGVGLVVAAAVAGCSTPPDVPFLVRATEIVWCADADGVVDTVTWDDHDGPLTELDVKVVPLDTDVVSEDELLAVCAGRFSWLTGTTLCEAYAAPEQLDRFATTEFVSQQYGEPGPDRPGFPVVIRGRVSCEDVHLQAGPAAAVAEAGGFPIADRLRGWQSSQRFNDWRAQEATWRDLADGSCLDIAAARDHGLTAQAELDGDWTVLETARHPEDPSHAQLCLDVRLQRGGFIEIIYHPVVSPSGRSGPVDDLTDAVGPDPG